MRTSIRTQKIRGFTLIELLIVVVLIGIVASLSVPSLTEYTRAKRVDGARSHLVGDLTHARMRAMSESRPVSLCVLAGTEYVIVRGLTDPATCAGEAVLKRVFLQKEYRGVGITVGGSPAASFTFDSRGLSRDASARQVVVQLGSWSRSFRVTPIGTVQHYE